MLNYIREKLYEILEKFHKDQTELDIIDLGDDIELDDWYLYVGARAGFEKN